MNPAAGRALLELHTATLRNDSRLGAREKELIAAFVSGLNACEHCFGVHRQTAEALRVQADLLEALLNDFERAPVEPMLCPPLEIAPQLTVAPACLTQWLIDASLAAG